VPTYDFFFFFILLFYFFIYRGSLKFNKQGINYFGKVVAHVSDLACSKVNKEAKLFPSILCTELHPTPKVWPKGFKDRGPSDDSIAIYIFPDNKRWLSYAQCLKILIRFVWISYSSPCLCSEQEFFDSLVIEMIRNDLAMRVVVTNAEFLVFTSTKLPLHLWSKLDGHSYKFQMPLHPTPEVFFGTSSSFFFGCSF